MKNYYRVMLGQKSTHAAECFAGNFIGADFGFTEDLSSKLSDEWRTFNHELIPVYLASHPGKSKIAAGLSCGFLWTVSKGIAKGDRVLCPDGGGKYRVGEVSGDYYFVADGVLPHRRPVHWLDVSIDRSSMSPALKRATGSIGTVSNVSSYRNEIEDLLGGASATLVPVDDSIEDPAAFVMEKHLEDFLVQNWAQTELGKEYDIYEVDGELVGQQYMSDTGPMDVLAISKDKKRLLVVELKRGRASDVVVGQILRYMGYVKEELADVGHRATAS